MKKILLTSTSFMDTPGVHHEMLNEAGFEIDRMRGPLTEEEIYNVIDKYDALICGDDDLTYKVLKKGKESRLRAISKYGIGLDKIDLSAAKELNIPVKNTPGVNQVSVAEHVFAHILAFYRNLFFSFSATKKGEWKRMTGYEMQGKQMAILGLGRIGKEVAIRAKAFGVNVKVQDKYIDEEFVQQHNLEVVNDDVVELFKDVDIICLHLPLTEESHHLLNQQVFDSLLKKPLIVNTSRAHLLNKQDLMSALEKEQVLGYVTDVMWEEPMNEDDEILKYDNVFITPHIGSRTFESVQRQGSAAVKNLIKLIS